jgi:hypothetical protein
MVVLYGGIAEKGVSGKQFGADFHGIWNHECSSDDLVRYAEHLAMPEFPPGIEMERSAWSGGWYKK